MEAWKGKVAVVSGAAVGIGAQISQDLTKAGMLVIGLDYTDEKVLAMKKASLHFADSCYAGQLRPYKCDISKENDIVETFKIIEDKYGGIDVLVNNAAICRDGLISTGEFEDFRDVIDTNLFGLTLCTNLAIKSMRKRNERGHIINVNSICGHYMPPLSAPKFNLYIATKRAMTAITEILRHEFRYLDASIKVTSISPGLVNTDIFNASKTTVIDTEFITNNPILESEDVSDAILYVLSRPWRVQIHEVIMHAQHELY